MTGTSSLGFDSDEGPARSHPHKSRSGRRTAVLADGGSADVVRGPPVDANPKIGACKSFGANEDNGTLINNRQAGRRRGRGGQRPPNNQGRPEQGNRIDNRARGNANQLHEKYKTLARDAQMQGDRVNSEYYLQFADHYFRVLSESRSRFEENNPQARRQQNDAAGDYDDDGDDGGDDRNDRNDARDQRDDDRRPQQQQQRNRDDRDDRDDDSRPNGRVEAQREERQPRRPRQPRPRADEAEAPAAIEADRLPPALSQDGGQLNGTDEEKPAPRRRTRRPRAEDGEGATQG